MNILFMGTPEFAIPSLEKLIASHHRVLAVVTGPDKPVGRGLKLSPTPVKQVAQRHGIPVLTPEKLSEDSFIAALRQIPADLYVVVAFRILPTAVFTIPSQGAINLHASLLPKYRGAAPINWAIINGESETGVTTFFIEQQVDAGNWILQRAIPISPDETAGELHDRLSLIGADLLLETVDLIESGRAPRHPQQGEVTRAPKITREICHIDWQKDSLAIYNLIRGLSPLPRAFTYYQNQELKICRAHVVTPDVAAPGLPGQIIDINKEAIFVATGRGVLAITELQPENKRRMSTAEYLRGHRLRIGELLN
ncbi:MAG: methionyl-tRNA formyltransferase [candidate division KSB1 bacterium]|nr:methionyl-tRNA formyltransferase [candidate division KSB1 bacterium]MDZ7333776.1 methionyl-tRNA formyltransferase [candidate division KSB1 bacterium]MDZ7357551.1 methionyl-tRNA formyltransferase [candidate division KSB1 bacterium]MDZ7377470.1 methionyl-tRNA formyltransferase [candidate division KSB1 bacterium]MDZ7400536.1 methionyl-tRNA formyltransferase [candidate division KSB1 bacterium]